LLDKSHLAFTPHDIGVIDPRANGDSAGFGPKIKIIEQGFECGAKFKRQFFVFKSNDEASLSCSQAERRSDRAGWSSWTAFEATQHSSMLLRKHPPSLQVTARLREVLTKILEILRPSSREIMEMALGKPPKDYLTTLIPKATTSRKYRY
jgi:hypothetical protein